MKNTQQIQKDTEFYNYFVNLARLKQNWYLSILTIPKEKKLPAIIDTAVDF